MRRIAFYGGSFNPPHIGHQIAILRTLEQTDVDHVVVAPVFSHPDGKDLVDYKHRLKMVKECLWAFNGLRVSVSNIEEQAWAAGGRGLTVNTLKLLLAQRPDTEIVLVVGSDIDETKWEGYAEIKILIDQNLVTVFNISRDLKNVSSTEIRDSIRLGYHSKSHLMPAEVRRYINQHSLYKE